MPPPLSAATTSSSISSRSSASRNFVLSASGTPLAYSMILSIVTSPAAEDRREVGHAGDRLHHRRGGRAQRPGDVTKGRRGFLHALADELARVQEDLVDHDVELAGFTPGPVSVQSMASSPRTPISGLSSVWRPHRAWNPVSSPNEKSKLPSSATSTRRCPVELSAGSTSSPGPSGRRGRRGSLLESRSSRRSSPSRSSSGPLAAGARRSPLGVGDQRRVHGPVEHRH